MTSDDIEPATGGSGVVKTEVFGLEVDEGGITRGSEILVDRGSKPMLEDILALLVNVNLSVKCK